MAHKPRTQAQVNSRYPPIKTNLVPTIQLQGAEPLITLFLELDRAIQKRIARAAVTAATTPVAAYLRTEARQIAENSQVSTGALARSPVGKVFQSKRLGTPGSITGARRKYSETHQAGSSHGGSITQFAKRNRKGELFRASRVRTASKLRNVRSGKVVKKIPSRYGHLLENGFIHHKSKTRSVAYHLFRNARDKTTAESVRRFVETFAISLYREVIKLNIRNFYK